MKNNKCNLVAEVRVFTEQKGKKSKHGRFERRIEQYLLKFFVSYVQRLVKQLPDSKNYTWKQTNKKTLKLVRN